MTIHSFVMMGVMVLSAFLGWKHADEPFFSSSQIGSACRSKKWYALLLVLVGAGVTLWVLLDPDTSTARETYHSMSTTGFKAFWLFLMGDLVLCFGVAQLAIHDAAASFHRFLRKCH